jgi:uncharacterized protein YdaU (DUF1376 family)
MSKIFRFDCYPHDWLLDTSRLTPEDRGIYVQIVMLIYARGGQIDNDAKWIAGSCNCSTRLVAASISRLVQMDFIQLSDGIITQKRAGRELNNKRAQIEKGVNGGRKSVETKQESIDNNDLPTSAKASDPPSTNPIPNPIPIESKPPEPPSFAPPEYFGRMRLDPQISPAWLTECQSEMGWAEKVAMDVWTKFSGYQTRKVGQAAQKTSDEWLAEWRTWYRKENIPASKIKAGEAAASTVALTPEAEAQQRRWFRLHGKQHRLYNPEGLKFSEAEA